MTDDTLRRRGIPRRPPGTKQKSAFPEDRLTEKDLEAEYARRKKIMEGSMLGSGVAGIAGDRLTEKDIESSTIQTEGMAEGGSVRGQKPIQVKKKIFKGVF